MVFQRILIQCIVIVKLRISSKQWTIIIIVKAILVCNVDCRMLQNQRFNVKKANTILAVWIMIDQILSGQLSKQLIQNSIAINKGFVFDLDYKIQLLKLNSS